MSGAVLPRAEWRSFPQELVHPASSSTLTRELPGNRHFRATTGYLGIFDYHNRSNQIHPPPIMRSTFQASLFAHSSKCNFLRHGWCLTWEKKQSQKEHSHVRVWTCPYSSFFFQLSFFGSRGEIHIVSYGRIIQYSLAPLVIQYTRDAAYGQGISYDFAHACFINHGVSKSSTNSYRVW